MTLASFVTHVEFPIFFLQFFLRTAKSFIFSLDGNLSVESTNQSKGTTPQKGIETTHGSSRETALEGGQRDSFDGNVNSKVSEKKICDHTILEKVIKYNDTG